MNRRDFLRRSAAGSLAPLAGSVLVGCGSGTQETGRALTVGLSALVHPTYIPVMAGPVLFGADFGLEVEEEDFIFFDSHSTTVLAALAGQVDIIGASTMAHLAIIAQGQPFKIFSPYANLDDFVIAGRGAVNSLAQFMDPNVTVAIDELAGAGQAIFDAMLLEAGAGFLVSEIPNRVIIGSTPGRTSALASGEVDATAFHLYQAEQVEAETRDLNIISTLYENVPDFMMLGVAAPQSWLDENLETAAAFTASVIQAGRQLKKSWQMYQDVVSRFVVAPPDQAILETIHRLANQYEIWSTGALERQRLEFMIELGKTEGVFEADLDPDDVADWRPGEMALEMLG